MLTIRQTRLAWLLVLPTLLVVAFVAGYPLAQVFYYSFHRADISFVEPTEFVGFKNYIFLLQDPDFRGALWNTLRFTVVSVFLETVLGLAIALVIHSNFRGRGIVRAAILIPWAIPTVVSAKMWQWMLNDIYGVINVILVNTGLVANKIAFLANPNTVLWAMVAVDVWKTTPFMALLLLAGLQLIPSDIYEAADIDGASKWQQFWTLTLPLLTPALVVALIFRTLDALRVFDVIFVMVGVNTATRSLAIYNRQTLIDFQDLGYGSAVSVAILVIIFIFVVLYMRVAGKGVRGED
ncbi:MAG: carbohydrate ABC transporter permease [Meiothermus ruber]|jgi:trehalose/maltose transport system permease protein|uniref:Binding-protein-dependent transport system inner membrane protein n=2 Tax=Meiothermus ruber TaxID=277 RepID=D3PTR0_MEIRD|nr:MULTISPECIES: sugar ABC transporter permease [Meiothermus]ADD28843.1 binding-protein-dependent transport systems inner membrane component [Meiothermus ruber DSM 1279]AGK05708.1 binding-protein-dependent transport system inner membrane protein [Meiothermus ruber DSM 1279]MCL6529403.1 sugar ABC transporter permease [Meiothermus ruber]MCX8088351.1 sugar ABC transporter permease [Meiothermus ruber]GIW28338.1 MAG: ABC transporter permease [Meiothermus sp.]